MPNLRSKQTGETATPSLAGTPTSIPPGIQDHSFVAQAIYEINQKIGALEAGLHGATDRLSRLEGKVDQAQIDLTAIKTTTGHIESLIKSALKIIVATAAGIGVFLLSVFGMWLKHKMGW